MVKGKYLHKFKNSEYTLPGYQSEENIWGIPAKWTEQRLTITEDEEGSGEKWWAVNHAMGIVISMGE